MKKFSPMLALCAPLLILGACASSTPQIDAAAQTDDAAFAPHVFQVHSGQRAPSSDCDANATWQAQSAAITVGPGGGTTTQVVKINQVQNCKKVVMVNGTCYQDVPSPDGATTTVTYTGYSHCSTVGGGGKSPLWNAYYAAPQNQKSADLAKAIKGIGVKSADSLVAAHWFDAPRKKPASWDQFVQMIDGAANQNPPLISKSVRTQVVGTYAADNMTNLGYTDATSCTSSQINEQVPVIVSQAYTCPQQQEQTYQNVLSTQQQQLTLNVSGSVLQPFERDQLSVSVGYDGRNIAITDPQAGPYNTYTWSQSTNGMNTVVNFAEQKRDQVSLPADILSGEDFEARGTGTGDFMLQVNLAKYAPSSPSDQVMVDYYISSCPITKSAFGWLGKADSGHCAIFGNPWVKGQVMTRPLSAMNHIAIPAPHDHKVKVSYTIYRRNSRFYDNQPLGEQTTKDIRGN